MPSTDRIEKIVLLHAPLERVWRAISEPMRRFSFRWCPYGVEPGLDVAAEPTTLVAFELQPVDGGTRPTITESGFDRIPLARRAKAFASNDAGWTAQATLIEKYLALAPR